MCVDFLTKITKWVKINLNAFKISLFIKLKINFTKYFEHNSLKCLHISIFRYNIKDIAISHLINVFRLSNQAEVLMIC